MPVHNEEPFLADSIRSILAQTFEDFEFVILDDSSTDASASIAREWARRDKRIRLVTNPHRLGVTGSANRVVRESLAAICARMDGDDIAHPDRLKREWNVLQTYPDVCLVGTLWEAIDEKGRYARPRDRTRLLRRSSSPPFPHGSVMFRRSVFDKVGGYRELCRFWEDRDLFLRMSREGRIMVLPDALYRFRYHLQSTRSRSAVEDLRRAIGLMHRCLALHRAGHDYTHLLHASGSLTVDDSADLYWLYSIGSHRLWAGHSPGILSRLQLAGGVRLDGLALRVLALAVLGGLSPGGYRLFMRWLYRARDWRAGYQLRNGTPIEWRFG